MKVAMLTFIISVVSWGLVGTIVYFVMAFIPGFTEAQRDIAIPVCLLGGVILGVYEILAKRRKH